MMKFNRVVGIVGRDWASTAELGNLVAQRGLFGLEEFTEENEIQREVCEDVLYLLLPLKHQAAGDESRYGFQEACKHEQDVLRKLMFMFLSCHVVLWVEEDHEKLSLEPFRLLMALNGARQKVSAGFNQSGSTPSNGSNKKKDAKISKRGWPGKCQPWLSFVYSKCSTSLENTQEMVNKMLKTYRLGAGGICRTKANKRCLSTELDPIPTVMQDLIGQCQVEPFAVAEWINAGSKLAEFLFISPGNSGLLKAIQQVKTSESSASSNSNATQALSKLDSVITLENQYCKTMCELGVPRALGVYCRGLPARYNSMVHNAHLEAAMVEFRNYTGFKGTMARKMEKKVAENCKKIWRGKAVLTPATKRGGAPVFTISDKAADRRLCDAVSLSGNPCILLFKQCITKPKTNNKKQKKKNKNVIDDEQNAKVNLKKCSSGIVEKLACSCGQTVIERADPFEERMANLTSVTSTCCKSLPSVNLNCRVSEFLAPHPADTMKLQEEESIQLVPSTGKKKRANNNKPIAGAWVIHRLGSSSSYDHNVGLEYGHFVPGYNRLERWPGTSTIRIGLEYECIASGSRQFFAVSSLASQQDNVMQQDDARQWPEFDVDLFVASESNAISQLHRIYIFVGATVMEKVLLHAQVQFEDQLFSHRPVQLPNDGLFCLCLPHVYINKATGECFQQPKPDQLQQQKFRSIARVKAALLVR